MAVAMQPEVGNVAGALVAVLHAGEGEVNGAGPGLFKIAGNEPVLEQPVARLVAKALDIEIGPLDKRCQRTDGMDAADKASHPLQGFPVLELRGATAAARIYGKAKSGELVQGLAPNGRCGDHRQFACGEFTHELVLLNDLRVAPALRTVELGHHRFGAGCALVFFQIDLIDAVFIAVESEHAPVAAQADALECVEYGIGRQSGIGRGHFGGGRMVCHAGIVRPPQRPTAGKDGAGPVPQRR